MKVEFPDGRGTILNELLKVLSLQLLQKSGLLELEQVIVNDLLEGKVFLENERGVEAGQIFSRVDENFALEVVLFDHLVDFNVADHKSDIVGEKFQRKRSVFLNFPCHV